MTGRTTLPQPAAGPSDDPVRAALADASRRGLTPARVATLAGMSRGRVESWTAGRAVASEEERVRLLAAVAAELARRPPAPLWGRAASSFGDALRRRRDWAGMDAAELAALAGVTAADVEALETADEPADWGSWEGCMAACLPPRPRGWDGGHEADALLVVADRAPRPPGYWEQIDRWWTEFRSGWWSDSRPRPAARA